MFQVSINNSVTGKDIKALAANMGGWVNVDVTLDQLVNLVAVEGFAWSNPLAGNRKVTSNFLNLSIMALDFDSGMTLVEAKEDSWLKANAAFIYTSASHQKPKGLAEPCDRFRVVFILDNPITDIKIAHSTIQGLLARYPQADKAVSSVVNAFFGTVDAEVHVFGNTISTEVVAGLVPAAKTPTKKAPGIASQTRKAVARGEAKGPVVEPVDGSLGALLNAYVGPRIEGAGTYERTFSIACALVNEYGHEKAVEIGEQWFASSNAWDWEKKINSINEQYDYSMGTIMHYLREGGYTGKVEYTVPVVSDMVESEKHEVQYVSDGNMKLEKRVVMIQAATGMGKTEFVKQKFGAEKVMVITHRRSLSRNYSQRMNLPNYQDDGVLEADGSISVVADSSFRIDLKNHRDSIVVLDEFSQLLRHYMGETMKRTRNENLDTIRFLLENAKKVIIMDATFDIEVQQFLVDVVGIDNIEFHKFTRKQEKVAQFYDSRIRMVNDMLTEAKDGKRLFICTDSKAEARTLGGLVAKKIGEKVLVIDSDSTTDENVLAFIESPNIHFPNYQVVVTSPAITSGVDITLPVDRVYSFSGSGTLVSADVYQSASRCRNTASPTRFFAKCARRRGAFGGDATIEDIRNTLSANVSLWKEVMEVRVFDWQPKATWPAFERFFVASQAAQNRDVAHLHDHLVDLLKNKGWSITVVSEDATGEEKAEVAEVTADVKQDIEIARRARMESYDFVTEGDFQIADCKLKPTAEDNLVKESWNFQLFRGVNEREEAINTYLDLQNPGLFKAVHSTLAKTDLELAKKDQEEEKNYLAMDRNMHLLRKKFYKGLLAAANFDLSSDFSVTLDSDTIAAIRDYLLANSESMVRFVGKYKNLETSPMQAIREIFVNHFGMEVTGKKVRDGNRTFRTYTVVWSRSEFVVNSLVHGTLQSLCSWKHGKNWKEVYERDYAHIMTLKTEIDIVSDPLDEVA